MDLRTDLMQYLQLQRWMGILFQLLLLEYMHVLLLSMGEGGTYSTLYIVTYV